MPAAGWSASGSAASSPCTSPWPTNGWPGVACLGTPADLDALTRDPGSSSNAACAPA